MLTFPFEISFGSYSVNVNYLSDINNMDCEKIPDWTEANLKDLESFTPDDPQKIASLIILKKAFPNDKQIYEFYELFEKYILQETGIKIYRFNLHINKKIGPLLSDLGQIIWHENFTGGISLPTNRDIVNALSLNCEDMTSEEFNSLFHLYIFFKYKRTSYGNAIVRNGILEINNKISETTVNEKYTKTLKHLMQYSCGGKHDIDHIVSRERIETLPQEEKECYKWAKQNREKNETRPIVEFVSERSTLGILGNPFWFKVNFQVNVELSNFRHRYKIDDVEATQDADFEKLIQLIEYDMIPLKFTNEEQICNTIVETIPGTHKIKVIRNINGTDIESEEIYKNAIIERYNKELFTDNKVPCSKIIRSRKTGKNFYPANMDVFIQDGYDIQRKELVTEVFADSENSPFIVSRLAVIKNFMTKEPVNLHIKTISEEILNSIIEIIKDRDINLFIHTNSRDNYLRKYVI